MHNTHKNIIQKYIVLKINSSEWKPGEKIPSENQMALKFKCSRLTARDAMQSLVNSGVLHSKKGSGYSIPKNHEDSSLVPFAKSRKVLKTDLFDLKDDKWLKQYFHVYTEGREVCFIKKYYDKKGQLATQLTIFNKNLIWEIDRDLIQESITKFLAKQGVAIHYSDITIKMINKEKSNLMKFAYDLGWKNMLVPVEIITSYSQEGWVEKTIRITRPDSFESTFTKRNYL